MSNEHKWSSRSQGKVASTLLFKFSEKKLSTGIRCDISTAIQLHCLAMTLLSNLQNLQKVETDIVLFNGSVLGHAWHTWCKKDTNGKRMSCTLLICLMQIFKSIDFRTIGLCKLITFILMHTVLCYSWIWNVQ